MTKKLLVPFIAAVIAISGILLSTGSVGISPQASTLSASPSFLGHIELVAKDANGNIKAYRQTDNIVVSVGKNCAAVDIFGVPANGTATACGGVTTNQFKYVGVGTGANAATISDVGLQLQVGNGTNVRASNGTYTLINTTASTPTYSIQSAFRPNANIAEAGIFDQNSYKGHMFARQTFTAINLASSDTLTVTWRVTLS